MRALLLLRPLMSLTTGPTTRRALSMTEDYLRLEEHLLLRQCRVDVRRDSGPGGQHRNKIESAVRITHEPTATVVKATEDRSQLRNRQVAFRRLRRRIGLTVRRVDSWLEDVPFDGDSPVLEDLPPELLAFLPWKRKGPGVGKKSELLPIAEQALLDVLEASSGSVAIAARVLGTTTAPLSKLLANDPDLLSAANALRATHGLPALRPRRQNKR